MMNRTAFLTISLLLSALWANAGDGLFQKEHLKILDIGNSYTLDATDLLPDIVKASGSDVSDMALWMLVRSAGSFKTWCDCYYDRDDKEYWLSKRLGGLDIDLTGGTVGAPGDGSVFREALTKVQWDLVIIHPLSSAAPYADRWYSDGKDGCLEQLIAIIKKHQPQAAIGFYIVHSTWGGYVYNTERSSYKRWELIANSVRELAERNADGGGRAPLVDIIIPYGTAIENLRRSSLNNDYDLTRDGLHCAFGLGQYAAACCYYQAVIAPRSGISVLGNTARVDCEGMESPYPVVPVDDRNAIIAQRAAMLAMADMYACHDPEAAEIDGVKAESAVPPYVYTLSGMRILPAPGTKGVFIRDEKKVIYK